ncbi:MULTISPECIES: FUSC family protein [unclassified Novosphingobium]|uniref:FUSC family protein n=1 Tax=unclassified Novosphingobium TaxID=2644732 RepID=UPI000D30D59D|nr:MULTISPECIES: FUSC family protein [unclassified Novosphingobium]MBB3359360.1 putative membrane protein YccC [Novosphingobium sp. BK256]MBB3375720.1 putative membrane protein YccC [Novosphingobium sp. BK280]MBB3380133.1 putative membrane protein YccC [Novosphingobium sp. BK258]MBB3421827.1 putative membrane protein YccC [Novosphingobium sp. BK267]MBB3450483.1 putative membrane protein YccC [Novosphingobium sp. BK352]MBB3478994.1 putative membrane protein YccC [Novosphingobium sp. BK369]MBB
MSSASLAAPDPDADPLAPRLVDEAECVASVLLAILVAHHIGATHVSWAAFTGYMVMRGYPLETLRRALLRIIGTALGALACLAVLESPLGGNMVVLAMAMALAGTVSLYGAITGRHAYAWLFLGLTFAMMLYDRVAMPLADPRAFAVMRMIETLAGTAACMAVSLASAWTLRRRWPAIRAPKPQGVGWRPDALLHGARGGLALALLLGLATLWDLPSLVSGAITIMAVMLIPVTAVDGPNGLRQVSRRLWYRLLGCLAGGALAALVLGLAALLHGPARAALMLAGTAMGVALGRHLENGNHGRGYVGTQFTLAVLVVLVPDSWEAAHIAPGFDRLVGILVGMAVLEPVLLLGAALSRVRTAVVPANQRSEAGGV